MRRIRRWWSQASAPVRIGTLDGLIVVLATVAAYVGDNLHILQGHVVWLYLAMLVALNVVLMTQLTRRSGDGS